MKMGIQIFLLTLDSRFRGNDNHAEKRGKPHEAGDEILFWLCYGNFLAFIFFKS